MKRILLTGSSGVVGSALLPRLGEHDVTVLTHRRAVVARSVQGDLTRPLLGLSRNEHDELAGRIDTVVHCAAVVDFDAPAQEVREVNLRGTERMLEFCSRGGADLIYVSTAFVARVGMAARGEAPGAIGAGAYVDSKVETEAMVRASGVTATIARPSVVIGDSRTGAMPKFQAFYYLLEEVLHGRLPVLPAAAGTRFDLIPQDVVAEALAALASRPVVNADYWLTCGDAALTLTRQVELLRWRAARFGIDVEEREMLPGAEVQATMSRFAGMMSEPVLRRFAGFAALAGVFDGAPPFPSSLDGVCGGPGAMTAESAERAFVAAVDYIVGRVRDVASRRVQLATGQRPAASGMVRTTTR